MTRKYLCLAVCALCLCACGGNGGNSARTNAPAAIAADDGHNAENSLDYTGVYEGTIPAADCPGIDVRLELRDDNTFECRYEYLERDTSFEFKGRYRVEKNLLTAVGEKSDTTYYKVEENRLRQLDSEKQPIPGKVGEMYVLTKQGSR